MNGTSQGDSTPEVVGVEQTHQQSPVIPQRRRFNQYRLKQRKDGSNRTRCADCGTDVDAYHFKRHCESNRHQEAIASRREQGRDDIPPGTDTNVPLPNALDCFLSKSGDATSPLAGLAAAYKEELDRAGGTSRLEINRDAPLWRGLGLYPPLLLPVDGCWRIRPASREQFLAELLHDFDLDRTVVYKRGSNDRTCASSNFCHVLTQLEKPDETNTYYAINMKARSVEIQLPEQLQAKYNISTLSATTTTNVTPKFAAADLHVDHGRHGVTGVEGGCVKLWALYPPTDQNLTELEKQYDCACLFLGLQGQLEGGEFCVQTEREVIYLPSGCLHATITLEGGLTPGFEFTSPDCLRATAAMWDITTRGGQSTKEDSVPLLECIMACLEAGTDTGRDRKERAASMKIEAESVLCTQYAKLARKKHNILNRIKRLLDRTICHHYSVAWKDHK
ncbi:Uu.00g036600.m01.CDS01 [Anthostomella pinea]|uniref:Uu.00g036600.m01.CDS01 n=1 Tax=Anthostomella pinea TaxID=933095 RepID=A0AAI8YDK2_9PEZI|nr:Uu.00g036600.m01.CDS01 [Anthostomella pinea]